MSDINSLLESFKNISSVLPLIYKDVAQPGLRKVGKALETVLDTPNTFLLLLKWPNEIIQLKFNKRMEIFRKKLEDIDEEKICNAPPEIGVPILDRLSYITNEDIAYMFINILTKASSNETIMQAHPNFIHILDSISSDEAIIINHIKYTSKIEYITLNLAIMTTIKLHEYPERLTGLEYELKLDFPQNIEMYCNNLMSLGILEPKDALPRLGSFDHSYEKLLMLYDEKIKQIEEENKDLNLTRVNKMEGYYHITKYGKSFIEACTN